jgi:hypothetical protein
MVAMQGPAFDVDYVRFWLNEILGAGSEEAQKFEAALLERPS